jgi:plasmid stability protein
MEVKEDRMAQLTIRRIDEALYRRLKERAKLNGRSLEAEARVILEGAAKPDRSEIIRWSAALRARLARRYRGDATAAIREDRER